MKHATIFCTVLVLSFGGLAWAEPKEETFSGGFSGDWHWDSGGPIDTGWQDQNGHRWFYYPDTGWWNQWRNRDG